MTLSTAITEHNTWFHSRQDEYYMWFLEGGHEAMTSMLADLSGRSHDAPIDISSHSKYILDNGEYAFLLVGVNGEAEKLSPAFELSDENTNLGEDEAIPSTMINTGAGMETVRYIPADSNYEFPLRDEKSGETSINNLYLEVIDEVYEPYFAAMFPAMEATEDEANDLINKKLKELLVGNLAKRMVSAYYRVPWVDLIEEGEGLKDAYEYVVQQTFSDFSARALNEATEGLSSAVLGDDAESE